MRRLAVIALLVLGGGAAWLTLGATNEPPNDQRYWVELDNAFGLIEGADVKVAGVRAGKITEMKIDRSEEAQRKGMYRALVGIDIKQEGFGSMRKDAHCETRPQSLIGEYFIDCRPGRSREILEEGGTIPVEQTGSTVAVDLVNNIMRRPFRERFRILLGELGAALAARGPELNEAIRRANPALRETDKVLAILAEQRTVIRDLVEDADVVLRRLANNRRDVVRFVEEARDTASTSAERAPDIQRQFQTFPTFLRELRPTMAVLEDVADAQAPALRSLNTAAPHLKAFLDQLAPFARASRPSFRTLAGAARVGRRAARAARPNVRELRRFSTDLPELADNLSIVLKHLDDQDRAAERDARSPGGKGFSGLQAILQYVFRQSQAINLFDANSYILKVTPSLDNRCAQYADAAMARDPIREHCHAWLGPNQPGVNQPDPTAPAGGAAQARSERGARRGGSSRRGGSRTSGGSGGGSAGSGAPADVLPEVLGPLGGAGSPDELLGQRQTDLLDFLLSP